MKKITKCVIPAAWLGTRFLPATKALPKEMFPIIDKPVMQLLVEEAITAWCTDIIIITWRSKRAIEDHFDSNFELEDKLDKSWKFEYLKTVKGLNNMANIAYVRQPYPRWNWEALLRAKNFIWDEPFLVLFWDDLVDCDKGDNAAIQLIKAYEEKQSSIIATVTVNDKEVQDYWIIESSSNNNDCFLATKILEKPNAIETNSRSWIIWKFVLTNDIFEYLEKLHASITDESETLLTVACDMMKEEKDIYWLNVVWERYDTWSKMWFLKATVSYGLKRDDLKDEFWDFLKGLNI